MHSRARDLSRPRHGIVAAMTVALLVVMAVPTSGGAPAPPRDDLQRPLSVPLRVLTPFDRPDERWSPGHRGVDLAAPPVGRVVAPAEGTIGFAGPVAGRPVVSVDHGDGLRTTYEPVRAVVAEGDEVSAGQLLGHVLAGHPSCPGETCLHWGARVASGGAPRDDDYVDPLALLGPDDRPIRLKPLRPGDAAP